MGLPPAEVAAGVREVLADRGLVVRVDEAEDGVSTFSLAGVVIRVSPLPRGRPTTLRFHPRTHLSLAGRGPLAEAIRSAIRLRFLRTVD